MDESLHEDDNQRLMPIPNRWHGDLGLVKRTEVVGMNICKDAKIIAMFESNEKLGSYIEILSIQDRCVRLRMSVRSIEGPIMTDNRYLNEGDTLGITG